MIKAPSITSLRVQRLAANFVQLTWDNVGGNFYYVVERKNADTEGDGGWVELGFTETNGWFDNTTAKSTHYIYRVASTYATFEMADWVESEIVHTFDTNAYNFSHTSNLRFSHNFINEKFTKNEKSKFDFNTDAVYAGLMGDDYTFTPEISNTSSVDNFFVKDKERHELQGSIEAVCISKERTMIMEIDGVLYLLERFQPVVKVSNNQGQNWIYYKAFNGVVGNPVSRIASYQSNTTTYVLGYNEIFFGRPTTNIRWSDNTTKFSTNQHTFVKLGDDNLIGFPVEVFGSYIDLPANLNKRAEAIAASNEYLYVGGRNTVYRADTVNPKIGLDGKRVWDEVGPSTVTTDEEDRAIIQKLDVVGSTLYALVAGRVKTHEATGIKLDPTDPDQVDETSEFDGVYVYDVAGNDWTRIFGNTEEERSHLSYSDSKMSSDGSAIIVSYANRNIEVIKDEDLPDYPEAAKYNQMTYFPTDKKYNSIAFRLKEGVLVPAPQRYFGEYEYTWSRRSGTRAKITPNDRVDVIYPTRRYEYQIDEDRETTKEIWDEGKVTIMLDDISFRGFSNYANGVLFYRAGGDIIGYYEFNYRVRDSLDIFWQPTHTFLVADLAGQTRDDVAPPEDPYGLVDPDISPLLVKLAPESYLPDDSIMTSFADNYMKFLSSGKDSYYNRLKNLIRNKYPKEEDSFEYLYSEINRRNIYLDKAKKEQVVRFFETRSSDFYSTKGVEESYRFLFKLLFDADVSIDIESLNGLEYDIVVLSGDVNEDIVGTTVYTPTGRANVTYIEREYVGGRLQWRITIHNLIGKFIVGQVLKSEKDSKFDADIIVGVRGKEISYNDIDYINRSRVYYTMKIKSEIPLSRYKDDVVRFVHPIGFGFIGITILSVLIASGLLFRHRETIMDIMKTYRWDAGLPSVLPDTTYVLDINQQEIQKDPITGKAEIMPHPHAGEDPIAHWPNYDKDEKVDPRTHQTPSERRKKLSPVFDAAWITYCYFSILEGRRLKDNIGNPRDPANPSQIKV